jgi:hypothetical protein
LSRKHEAIISAVITLLIFTVLPLYSQNLLPPNILESASQIGFDIEAFTNQISIIGLIVASLTLVKGFFHESSVPYLLASLASSGMTLFFTVMTLSLGQWQDLGTLGITSITMEGQGVLNTTTVDLSFFVTLTAVTVCLKMIHSTAEFLEARSDKSKEKNSRKNRPVTIPIEYKIPRMSK